jgi:outer membrane protein insertion porin family
MRFIKYITAVLVYLFTNVNGFAQLNEIDLTIPHEYNLAKVRVEGAPGLDENAIILLSELKEGELIKIPGDVIPKAIKKLWEQKLFSNIRIDVDKVIGNDIFLVIIVGERRRLSRTFPGGGARKKEFENVFETLDLYKGKLITEDMMYNVRRIAKDYFVEKGYYRTKIELETGPDSLIANSQYIKLKIIKGSKIKIKKIDLEGVTVFKHGKLYRAMKEIKRKKWWRFWKGSKFLESEYKTDKTSILNKYYDKGYRDAVIVFDTVYDYDSKSIAIKLKIDEGKRYYFRNISWIGNSKYRSGFLDTVLSIKKGDVYDQGELESHLFMNQNGGDITSLYMDNGYLFFSVTPVEVRITNDSIDYEMRISEGKQARVRDIIIKGNTKTNEHIIRREIRTKPGDLFSRDAIIRTQRELSQMNYFDPEKMGVNPIPDPATGTVDIEYTVEEKPSDQIQLSGGWGGGRVIGTVGLTISNFSARNFFNGSAWRPLPSGDGQQLSLNCQSTGAFYQGYNLSFVEPWLGGKKPNSLSVNAYHTFTSNDSKKFKDPEKSKFKIYGASVGLGKRLKWPDDYFSVFHEISYQYYDLQKFGGLFSFSNGYVNNLAYRFTLSRNSISQPIYPREGSNITFTAKTTAPYSLFNGKDYSVLSDQEKFNLLEYAKFKFTTSYFLPLSRNKKLVLNARTGFGFLLPWNKKVGESPFERFYMGGSGLTGVNFQFGREIIALRGYDDNAVSSTFGDPYIAKYVLELRYPISLNPSATVFILGFTDGGKTWSELRKVNPFEVYRSAGVGVRLFLPMFGMLGFDYAWRLDTIPFREGMQKSQFHFTIGMNLGEL